MDPVNQVEKSDESFPIDTSPEAIKERRDIFVCPDENWLFK
jgi:hypothetical protein